MNEVEQILNEYYNNYNEDERLIKDKAHQLEFITTTKYIEKYLLHCMEQGYDVQEEKLGSSYRMQEFMRIAVLSAIDDAWVEQVDYLQQLQTAVSGRASAQRNLIYEYQQDALESFHKMEKSIKRNIVRNILLSDVYVDDKYKLHMLLP